MAKEQTADQSFPRSARLLTSADFQNVFQRPKKFHFRHFSVFVASNSHQTERLGLAVSKKALPRAVDRNRIKRAVREEFRKNRWQFSALDVIFLARKELRTTNNEQLIQELSKVWKQLAKYSDTLYRD